MNANKLLKNTFVIITLLFYTSAQADIDQQNLAGTSLAGAGALSVFMGVAAGAALAVTGGLAIGALGVAILIKNGSSPPSTPSGVPITINLNPNQPLITPAGWTSPTQPPSTQTPTSTHSWVNGRNGQSYSSFQAACDASIVILNSQFNAGALDLGGCVLTRASAQPPGTPTDNEFFNIHETNTPTCPGGYTVSGTTCNLTASSQVVKPVSGVQEVKRVGNTFETDTQANPADKLPSTVAQVTSNKVTVHDSNGSVTTVTLNSDGTSDVVTTTPNTDGTSTKSSTQFGSPDSTGQVEVIGKATQTLIGQGTLSNGTTSGTSNFDKSGLATDANQATQITKSTETNAKLDQIHNDLNCDNCVQPNTTTLQTDIQNKTKEVTDIIDAVPTQHESDQGMFTGLWTPAFTQHTCTPLSGSISGKTISINHCPAVDNVKSIFSWLYSLFGMWYITMLLFKKDN